MALSSPLKAPFDILLKAQHAFRSDDFQAALALVDQYYKQVSYDDIPRVDQRRCDHEPAVSYIVVTTTPGSSLDDCLQSLKQSDELCEVIVVVNAADSIDRVTAQMPESLCVKIGCNILPSEARNIGAHFARGKYLAFIDDDAIVGRNHAHFICEAFSQYSFAGVRGKIVPKSGKSGEAFIGHYDKGEFPLPSPLDTEGNAALPADVFNAVGGFDPLIFGGEGPDLSYRILERFPEKLIYYWPNLSIKHDYATGGKILAKRERQLRTLRYQKFRGSRAPRYERNLAKWLARYPGVDVKLDQRALRQRLWARITDIGYRVRISFKRFYGRG